MDSNEKLSLQIKLKPNQRLSCASCALFFEDILSASEHIVTCKVMPLASQKRANLWAEYSKRRAENSSGGSSSKRACNVSPLISSQWTKSTVATLLKAIFKSSKDLGDMQCNQSKIWHNISAQLIDKHPWALQSVCQIKWRKLCEDVNAYEVDAMSHSIPRPPFYCVVRELQKRVKRNNEKSRKCRVSGDASSLMMNSVKVEEGEVPPEDDLADPDAFEEDPFSGVLDSQGSTVMREVLLDIVQSIESFDYSVAQMAEKHNVEEDIVHWVKTNQDAVTKGSLQCPTCDRQILKRKEYLKHTLDCAEMNSKESLPSSTHRGKAEVGQEWPSFLVEKLIKIFSKACRAYLTPQETIRVGLWLEIYKGLKREISGLTPRICSSKWKQLVLSAKEYHDSQINPNDTKLLKEPPFYKGLSYIVDLSKPMTEDQHFLTLTKKFLASKTNLSDNLLEFPYESNIVKSSNEGGKKLIQSQAPLSQTRGGLAFDLHDQNPTLKQEIVDNEDLDDEQTDSDEEDQLVSMELMGEDLDDSSDFPDESSIHLMPFPRDGSIGLSDDEDELSEPLLKGIEKNDDAILSTISQLREETQSMKSIITSNESTIGEKLDHLEAKFSQGHAETIGVFKSMSEMMERHHKDNLEALTNLTNAILQSRSKI